MALYSLRLRRGLTATVSTLHRSFFTVPAISSPPTFPLTTPISTSSASSSQSQTLSFLLLQSRQFRSSPLLSSIRKSKFEPTEEIGPDSILFEGCDYNHWLITMEFPKDPAPSPEEMVATYEKTCAAGLGISLEEAKKRMYACSTTTYVGFQAVMTEEESEKFRGVPGVVFILPDSYIDPQNKEYGGDKYDNGHITPRPPPFQYNNRQRGRYNDQNRSGDRGLRPNQQRDSAYQGYTQGDGRTNAVPQNYPPQQNYAPGVRDNYQVGRRDPMPSYQGNPNQAQQNNFYPQERRDFPQGDRQNYAPSGQRDFSGDNRNYAPRNDGNFQGPAGQYGQQGGRAYGQGANSEYPGHGGQSFPQMDQRNAQGDQRSYAPIGQTGTYQMDQRNVQGEQRNYPPVGQTGTYQMDQRNVQEEQRNYTPMGQTGTYQGR